MSSLLNFLVTVLNASTPILFAAAGILIMQESGVMNIGAEGMMLIGAFSGYVGSYVTGNVVGGALFSLIATGIVGAIYGLMTITLKANQVVIGIAINIFAEGITTTLYRTMFGMSKGSTKVAAFEKMGPLIMPVYIGLLMIAVLTVVFDKTKIGPQIKGAGEYPQALDSMGIHVNRVRYVSVIVGSAIIGFGGAFLSLGELSFFTENMVSGRGYIAMAAVIFGRYTPVGVLFAVLLFGAGEAAVYKLSALGLGIPTQFILMIPYVLTLIVIACFGHEGAGPKALGVPFSKDEC